MEKPWNWREETDASLSPKSYHGGRDGAKPSWNSPGLCFFAFVLGGALLICAVFAPRAAASTDSYVIRHSFVGDDFFTHWSFYDGPDPTHGTVEFVTFEEASGKGLISAAFDRVYMGVDATEVLSGSQGRKAVRLESNEWFKDGLFIIELDHAPIACGAWPAFWMYGEDSQHAWPRWGEYDILEAVHNQTYATTTLHTRSNCDQYDVNKDVDFSGSAWAGNEQGGPAKNCWVHAPNEYENQGCGQKQPQGSWGTALNQAGGGTWAAEWDPDRRKIRTWFFRKGQEPADLLRKEPDPDTWAMPTSFFTLHSKYCSPEHFQHMRLVFDTTFCGDYGDATFSSSCPATGMSCKDYVQKNPHVFSEAYWSIRTLDIYRRSSEQPGVLSAPVGVSYEKVKRPSSGWTFSGLILISLGMTGLIGICYAMLNKADEASLVDQEMQGLSSCMEDVREMDVETTVDQTRRWFSNAFSGLVLNLSEVTGMQRPEAVHPQRTQRIELEESHQQAAMGSHPTRQLERNFGSQDRMNSGNLVRPPPPTSFMSRASAVTSQAWSSVMGRYQPPAGRAPSTNSLANSQFGSHPSMQTYMHIPQGTQGSPVSAASSPKGWNYQRQPSNTGVAASSGWQLALSSGTRPLYQTAT